MLEVRKGGFADISCTSSGVPVPTITWTFNNQPVPFSQTNTVTNYSAAVSGVSIEVTKGNITSTLHIVNAQYPDNAGEYVCTGSNTDGVSSSSIITVHIPGIQLTHNRSLFREVKITLYSNREVEVISLRGGLIREVV